MPRILLVGSGITSAVTGTILKQKLPKAEFIVWDKAKEAGGRMSTFKNSKNKSSTVDMGAQYITVTPDYAELHSLYYEELKTAGVLVPLTAKVGGMKSIPDDTHHYVTPNGISSLVKHYLQKMNAEIRYQFHIQKVDNDGRKWKVVTQNGNNDLFDVVVLTMPVPQILALSGGIKRLIEDNKSLHKHLREVEYSSRYALGLFYRKDSRLLLPHGSCAEYIADDPIMRFVSIDNLKRGKEDTNPSVVFHTSVPFGKANLEKTPSEVEHSLLAKVKEMFPQWPDPENVACHQWQFSQVSSAFAGLPGAVEIGEGLIAGGDGFTHSNFDGCLESAKTISDFVLQYVAKL